MTLIQLWYDDRAQDLVEYALLAGMVAVSVAGALPGPVQHLSVIFSKMISLTDQAGT